MQTHTDFGCGYLVCLHWHHSTPLIIISMHATTHTIVFCYSLSPSLLRASSLFDTAFFYFLKVNSALHLYFSKVALKSSQMSVT